MKGDILVTVPVANIPVFDNGDGSYTVTVEKLDVDGDGTGGNTYHDPDFQDNTSYQPPLNADVDDYYVFPPCVFFAVRPMVLGCKSSIKRLSTGQIHSTCFPGDVGPHTKIGEVSTHLAQFFCPSKNPNNGFEEEEFEITFWPGIAAEGRTLQSV